MNNDSSQRLDAACRAVARQLVPATAQVQTRNVAECRGSPRNVPTQTCKNDKSNPPTRRRWKLMPRQIIAIEMLVAGSSVARAARTLGINPRTIFRWLKTPAFTHELLSRTVDRRKAITGSRVAAPPRRASEKYDDDELDALVKRDMAMLQKVADECRGKSRNVAECLASDPRNARTNPKGD